MIAVLLRELARTMPGELHLARALLGLPTRTAPALYVRRLFDSYSDRYDRHLFGPLDYRVPNLLRDLVGSRLDGTRPAVADLGCGTGALGPLFRSLAGRLDGIDLSPGMLARAEARGVYDELIAGDLIAFLRSRPTTYDLLLLADVLPYIGDPAPLLRAAAASLRPDGRLALSAERHDGGTVLMRTGRFAHDARLIEAEAAACGLRREEGFEAVPRFEAGHPVPGFVLLLQKSVS